MSSLDRISFGTDGWRDDREAFTDDRVEAVAQSFADYLDTTDPDTRQVAIGYDARADSPHIASTAADVLAATGYDVLLADRDCPTPSVAAAIDTYDLAGGIMVTASHNPPAYNGIKLIPGDGAPALPAVTDTIQAGLHPPAAEPTSLAGNIEHFDFVGFHRELVGDRLAVDLSGMDVAYDAMHGSGRGVTDAILEDAGASVRRLRCSRAPEFGGTAPEPEADRLEELIALVTAGEADIGFANDGDADRVAVVTPDGYLNANKVFAVMYDHLLEDDSGPAVRTVSTSFLIDRIAEAHGESVVETPVGFKWVAKAMGEHDALIGGEESGGFSVRGHVREKDGPMAAALVAAAHAGRPVDSRVDELIETHGEIYQVTHSVDCPEEAKVPLMAAIVEETFDTIAGVDVDRVNDADGVKFLLADGSWLLLRPSGTEPKMRVYAESNSPARTDELIDAGTALVETHQPSA